MPHFFISSQNINGNKVLITGPLVRHLRDSLRMKVGDKVHLIDQEMRGYYAILTELGRTNIKGEITGRDEGRTPNLTVTLIQATIKNKRMDLIIQKATELGVNEIIPIISERSVVRPNLSGGMANLRRWQTIAEEAAQQSNRWDIPSVLPPVTLLDYLDSAPMYDLAIILWEREEEQTMKGVLRKGGRRIGLLVGPEGGFTETEVGKARESGFIPVSLGRGTLRSETAAIAAISIIQYEIGELGEL